MRALQMEDDDDEKKNFSTCFHGFHSGSSSKSSSGMSSSTPKAKIRKNAAGARLDRAWEHGIEIDPKSKKVQCKFCKVIRAGGIYRLKHHLASTHQNAEPCLQVSDEVRNDMLEMLSASMEKSKQTKKKKFSTSYDSMEEEYDDRKQKGSMDRFIVKKGGEQMGKQSTINEKWKKKERNEVCQLMARWFYTSAIPFNAVNNPFFHQMVQKLEEYGKGLKPPSYHELRETFLKREVQETLNSLQKYKKQWKSTGCTIMSDAWTDQRKRTMNNFLVNSPAGTVFLCSVDTTDISNTAQKLFEMLDDIVEKVGEENVVQVVTNNAANYKAAGELLMEKRKNLFWTSCAAHCIDLMVEDFEKQDPIQKATIRKAKFVASYIYSRGTVVNWMKEFTGGKELVRHGITRFATSYLTMRRLNDLRGALFNFFSSEKWRESVYAKKKKGKDVCTIIFDSQEFWPNIELCLKIATPLIKILRMVDSDYTPAMGFLYKAMEQAKEEIKANLNNTRRRYEHVFAIIDKRWDGMLSQPLHAAGYLLNPRFQYSSNFQADVNVKRGLYECVYKMISSADEKTKIELQLNKFRHAQGFFGIDGAVRTREQMSPADWWFSYGDDCLELQKFAIRVLSLTCSSSGCERNWSAFELVHSKRRNRLAQKRMNDLVFVMYNLKLQERQRKRESTKSSLIEDSCENLPSDDEWITEKENPTLPMGNNWLRVLDEDPNHDTSEEEGSEDDEVHFITRNIMRASDSRESRPSGSRTKRPQVKDMNTFRLIDEDEDEDEDEDKDKDEDADNPIIIGQNEVENEDCYDDDDGFNNDDMLFDNYKSKSLDIDEDDDIEEDDWKFA